MNLQLDPNELLGALKAGEVDAWTVLVHQYTKKFTAISKGICRNEQDAQDVVQEVFIKLQRQVNQDSWNHTFFRKIVICTTLDLLRRKKVRPARTGIDNESNGPEVPDPRKMTPLDAMVEKESMARLRSVLVGLPPEEREMLIARHAGMTFPEIAEKFGLENHERARYQYYKILDSLKSAFGY